MVLLELPVSQDPQELRYGIIYRTTSAKHSSIIVIIVIIDAVQMLDMQGNETQKLILGVLCPVREKLVLLVPVDLRANRDPVERLVPQDLLDLLELRFVCPHAHSFNLNVTLFFTRRWITFYKLPSLSV